MHAAAGRWRTMALRKSVVRVLYRTRRRTDSAATRAHTTQRNSTAVVCFSSRNPTKISAVVNCFMTPRMR